MCRQRHEGENDDRCGNAERPALADALSLGALGALGHYCVAKAMTYASANFVAPFNYTQMIGSVIVGYLMFAEVPDFYTWLGTAVVVGAGLMVGWQGRKPQKS